MMNCGFRRRGGAAQIMLAMFASLLLAGLVLGGCAFSGYNKAIRFSEDVESAWAQVENQLQRRFDLIGNLVETVKGYAGHEKGLFTEIAAARAAYTQPAAGRAQRIEAANQFEGFLSRLLVIREAYPELKANVNFMALQDELSGTENRLAHERKKYNDAVRELNSYVRRFPGQIFAGWADVEQADYFEPPQEAQQAPKVDFSGGEE